MKIRAILASVLLASALFAAPAKAGDVRGTQTWSGVIGVGRTSQFLFIFKGDEMARVIVRGDGDGDIDCTLSDENGNVVSRDNDDTDTCLVRVTPLRTGEFTLRVKNNGKDPTLASLNSN